ncbi:MAG TPA: hypothetical protein VIA62_02360 [Thermoanaerobaculia bacterium]|nr:hypothetical protein [Thermoanaerobaculia bacterium]
MAHRLALVLLALAAPAALLAFCVGLAVGPWIGAFAGGVVLPIALMALGASRRGSPGGLRGLGRLWLPLLAVALVLGAGWTAILALPHGGPDVGGLPLATALMIFVLIPLPLAVLGLAYALTFDRLGLSPEDLERVRAARRPGTGTGA